MDSFLVKKILIGALPPVIAASVGVYFAFFNGKDKVEEAVPSTGIVQNSQHETSNISSDKVVETPEASKTAFEQAAPVEEIKKQDTPETQPKIDLVAEISGICDSPEWAHYVTADFLYNFILFLDEVSNGFVPAKSCINLRSEEPFLAEKNGAGDWCLSKATTQRYDRFVEIFCAINPQKAAAVYKTISPFLQTQMQEMGYPNADFGNLVAEALAILRATPDFAEPQPLVKMDKNIFHWKNPELEKLTPVQKFLLRLGNENLAKVKKHADTMAKEAGF